MLNFILWLEQSQMEEQLEDCKNLSQIQTLLTQNNINFFLPKTLNPILVYIQNQNHYVIDDFEYPTPKEASEWIYEVESRSKLEQYVKESNFNDRFWKSVPPRDFFVYHGTNKDQIASIKSRGLRTSKETRGIANRSTPPAVFTSENLDTARHYYSTILEINVSEMKRDKYTPHTSQEEPIEIAEMANSLAHLIGLEEFNFQIEDGLAYDTVLFYDYIPPKYINVL